LSAHAAWQEAELRRAEAAVTTSWRAHEAYVDLAFDFLEMREAEEAVAGREARVKELEEELRALGCGTEDTEDDEEEEDEEEEDGEEENEEGAGGSKEGEARESGGGGAGGGADK
jgi:hypothetical protein